MVVTSYVSRWWMTSWMASRPSCTVKWYSWWTVPINSATSLANLRSGAFLRPIENECSRGHHASLFSSSSMRLRAWRWAIDAISDESRPPDSRTPYGTFYLLNNLLKKRKKHTIRHQTLDHSRLQCLAQESIVEGF